MKKKNDDNGFRELKGKEANRLIEEVETVLRFTKKEKRKKKNSDIKYFEF